MEALVNRVLVTGGCGFMGSNVVNYLTQFGYEVIVLDSLTYAANRKNISESGAVLEVGDINDARGILTRYDIDIILHMAAESSVDKSINNSGIFMRTNIMGTYNLLESALRHTRLQKFIYVSTDEVYGSRKPGDWASFETDRYDPSSPYGASKTGATHLVQAYHKTYGLKTINVFPSNNFGRFQSPEKFIPLVITRALTRSTIPVYGDGGQVRNWIYVDDFCEAIKAVIERGRIGEGYNIGSDIQITNLEVAQMVCDAIAPETKRSLIEHVVDRPGHDRIYHINSHKAGSHLRWRADTSFEDGLKATIDWYVQNLEWVETMKEKLR